MSLSALNTVQTNVIKLFYLQTMIKKKAIFKEEISILLYFTIFQMHNTK